MVTVRTLAGFYFACLCNEAFSKFVTQSDTLSASFVWLAAPRADRAPETRQRSQQASPQIKRSLRGGNPHPGPLLIGSLHAKPPMLNACKEKTHGITQHSSCFGLRFRSASFPTMTPIFNSPPTHIYTRRGTQRVILRKSP